MLNDGTQYDTKLILPELYVHEVKLLCQPYGRRDIDNVIWGINSSILKFYNSTLNFRISKRYKDDVEKEMSDLSAPGRLSEKFDHYLFTSWT